MSWHNGSTATCSCDQCVEMRAAQERDERKEAERLDIAREMEGVTNEHVCAE